MSPHCAVVYYPAILYLPRHFSGHPIPITFTMKLRVAEPGMEASAPGDLVKMVQGRER